MKYSVKYTHCTTKWKSIINGELVASKTNIL